MLEFIIVMIIFFWLLFKFAVWLFGALIGILPYPLVDFIYRAGRFFVAVIIIILLLDLIF